MKSILILGVYYGVLMILTAFAAHRFLLVRTLTRHPVADPTVPAPFEWPSLTVQLPVFNEPAVIRRLIEAVNRLEYPVAFTVQILDDSTDSTPTLVRDVLASLPPPGKLRFRHMRRTDRSGFKAGALAAGLAASPDEVFVIFDADFVPPVDFLLRTVPHLCASETTGMVQARWSHLNPSESLLTFVQSCFLDSHFSVESAARFRAGHFFNFNGTAGAWKRTALEDAGGWSSDTVTEDLDISYRAQQAGWRFVYLDETAASAELPASLSSFQGQQFRWAKGSIQTGRKLLPSILSAPLSFSTRLEATVHLTNNLSWLLTVLLSLLIVPAVIIRWEAGLILPFVLDALLLMMSTTSLLLFYRTGHLKTKGTELTRSQLFLVFLFGIGMSASNSAAVLSGLATRGGVFNRTRKTGGTRSVSSTTPRVPVAEVLLATWFFFAIPVMMSVGAWIGVVFTTLFAMSYSIAIGFASAEWWTWFRHRAGRASGLRPEAI